MMWTTSGGPGYRALPYLVVAVGFACLHGGVEAQERGWRELLQVAEEARGEGDLDGYAAAAAGAVEAMPDGLLNRPFVQYHAARASALLGRPRDAVRYLRMAWDERIEALMISYADHDPAFDDMRSDPDFLSVMRLADDMRLERTPLGGSVHLLNGAGSNSVASVGEDGVLLVDAGYRPAAAAMRRALGEAGGSRVSILLLTHAHEDHVGGAEVFGSEAEVWAHPGTAGAMSEPSTFIEGVEVPAKSTSARPEVLVEHDTTFMFNGESVRIVPVPAHTTSDLAVYFARSRVLHLGDTYLAGNPMMFPGRSDPDGFLDGLERLLGSLHPETVVVGGHDPPTNASAVLSQIGETRACMSLVREAIERGDSLEEAVAAAEGRFTAPWIGFFYRLLTS